MKRLVAVDHSSAQNGSASLARTIRSNSLSRITSLRARAGAQLRGNLAAAHRLWSLMRFNVVADSTSSFELDHSVGGGGACINAVLTPSAAGRCYCLIGLNNSKKMSPRAPGAPALQRRQRPLHPLRGEACQVRRLSSGANDRYICYEARCARCAGSPAAPATVTRRGGPRAPGQCGRFTGIIPVCIYNLD